MTVRVRFAPSPTGKLHMGNMRTALVNLLFALKNKGAFVLRFEDTDLAREVPQAEAKMLSDFEWLGMDIDESVIQEGAFGPYRTRERAERGDYQKALDVLFEKGLAYECYVSKEELEMIRRLRTSQGLPPGYDNRHRSLSEAEKTAYKEEGRKPVIRFKLLDGDIVYQDLVRGEVRHEAKHLGGDPVIVRSNGVPTFTFAGAVDDINQNITHIIRGEDHVTNAAAQVRIFEALGSFVPKFAHLPMLLDDDGGKLSKRLDSLSVAQLRARGFMPGALVSYLAYLGTSLDPEVGNLKTLAQKSDLSLIGRSPVRFDLDQVARINGAILREMPWEVAQEHVEKYLPADHGLDNMALETFWMAVRGNIRLFEELSVLFDVCFGVVDIPQAEKADAAYLERAIAALPKGAYSQTTWKEWTGHLKATTDRKGKMLFMPLRLALTGASHGPELADLLPIIGQERAQERLQQALEGPTDERS